MPTHSSSESGHAFSPNHPEFQTLQSFEARFHPIICPQWGQQKCHFDPLKYFLGKIVTIEEDPPVFHSPPPQHGGHSPHFATPPPEFSGSAGADPRRRAGGGHPRHAGVSPSCLHPSLSSGGFILLPMLCALNIFKSISEEDISLLST